MPPPATSTRAAANLLFLAVMTMAMGQTLVFTLLPLLGRAVGLQEVQTGAIITASSVAYAVAARYWGRRSDEIGRRRVMLIGLGGYAGGTLIFAGLFWLGLRGALTGLLLWGLLIAARCLQALLMAGTMPAANAYISDISSPDTRTAAIVRLDAASGLGNIVGPAFGGVLAGLSLLAPMLFAGLAAALCALWMLNYLPESPRHLAADQPAARPHLRFDDARYRALLLRAGILLVAFSVVQQTLGYYAQDSLHLSAPAAAAHVGWAFMAAAAITLLAQTLLARRLRWPAPRLIRIGNTSLFAGSALLALGHGYPALLLAVVLNGAGMGLAFPACVAAATLTVEAGEQGALAGLAMAVPGLAFIIGPVLGTGLYQFDHRLPYCVNLGLLLIPLALRLQRRHLPA